MDICVFPRFFMNKLPVQPHKSKTKVTPVKMAVIDTSILEQYKDKKKNDHQIDHHNYIHDIDAGHTKVALQSPHYHYQLQPQQIQISSPSSPPQPSEYQQVHEHIQQPLHCHYQHQQRYFKQQPQQSQPQQQLLLQHQQLQTQQQTQAQQTQAQQTQAQQTQVQQTQEQQTQKQQTQEQQTQEQQTQEQQIQLRFSQQPQSSEQPRSCKQLQEQPPSFQQEQQEHEIENSRPPRRSSKTLHLYQHLNALYKVSSDSVNSLFDTPITQPTWSPLRPRRKSFSHRYNSAYSCHFKDYSLIKPLNEGIISTFIAKHIPTDSLVVLKMYKKGSDEGDEDVQSSEYQRELQMTLKAQGENVVELYQAFTFLDNDVMVFEYISKGDLFNSMLPNVGWLKKSEIKTLFKSICKGVKHLHDHNIVHRDLKPENITVINTSHIKIIDFGVSVSTLDWQTLDDSRMCSGSIPYMSPELIQSNLKYYQEDLHKKIIISERTGDDCATIEKQYQELYEFDNLIDDSPNNKAIENLDPKKIDMWALGILLYVTFFGRFPWAKALRAESQQFNDYLESSHLYDSSRLEPWGFELLHHLLHVDPAQRFNISQTLDFLKKVHK
eukprot:Awhi_evm1s7282